MSIDLKLGLDHDIAFGRDGDLLLVDGAESVAQQIEILLLSFLGEWFLDTDYGIPYFETIMIKSPSRQTIEHVLRMKILAIEDHLGRHPVSAVPTINIDIDAATRRAVITLPDMETSEGRITVSTNK